MVTVALVFETAVNPEAAAKFDTVKITGDEVAPLPKLLITITSWIVAPGVIDVDENTGIGERSGTNSSSHFLHELMRIDNNRIVKIFLINGDYYPTKIIYKIGVWKYSASTID